MLTFATFLEKTEKIKYLWLDMYFIASCFCCLYHTGCKRRKGTLSVRKSMWSGITLFAISEQRASGIPASVILGQGILETEAGASELMVKANNHFGIKCKNNWQGPTFLHTDDAKDECFKKYQSAEESYKDHSAHLINNPRYAPLFKCSKTDYAAWAVGLKRCGYATNPQYAQRLIKIIEDFRLQEYTYAALDSYMLHTYPALVDESPEQVFVSKDPPVKKEYVRDTGRVAVKDTLKSKGFAANITDTTQKWKAVDTSVNPLTETDPLKRIADSMNEVLTHNRSRKKYTLLPRQIRLR